MKYEGISDATKRYLRLGVAIVLGLIIVALVLNLGFHMELGSVSDLVSGLGAIIAILGIGWQTTIQKDQSEAQRRLECRPFSVTMRYWTEPISADTVKLYDSMDANAELDGDGENTRAGNKIKALLQQYIGIRMGAIRVQMEGDTPIYNVVLRLQEAESASDKDVDNEGKKESESIHIPVLRPNVKYICLTTNVLEKIHQSLDVDIKELEKIGKAKSRLYPDELNKTNHAQLKFSTACHEDVLISLSTKVGDFHLDKEAITYGKEIKEDFEAYDEGEGYSTRRVRIGE
ncbi:hypothetical protein ACFQ44_04450 [Levilactobacillus lanxiensis]|uniref:SMODS-associated and fused to various effectors domain-containing protein n=1 Tax=Levilactobacillus lanxiensis TaxID=2799568 RepID=A0ABW4D4R1_9LACO|nr:hypothetical protein [Levilactobacillus lanxiensis]